MSDNPNLEALLAERRIDIAAFSAAARAQTEQLREHALWAHARCCDLGEFPSVRYEEITGKLPQNKRTGRVEQVGQWWVLIHNADAAPELERIRDFLWAFVEQTSRDRGLTPPSPRWKEPTDVRSALTKRHKAWLDDIERAIDHLEQEYHYPPTQGDVRRFLELKNPSFLRHHLDVLRDKYEIDLRKRMKPR